MKQVFRRALERFSRERVITRRLPVDLGRAKIFVSPDASLQFWYPRWSAKNRDLMDMASKTVKPGNVVWDIGANVGLYSFAAAWAVGEQGAVYAIEPDVLLCDLLQKSSASLSSGYAKVKPICAAVSDCLDLAELHIANRGRCANFIGKGSTQHGGTRRVNLVPTLTLDWLAERLPAPDVIKIDVERMENRVLAGASNVLERHPRIVCECGSELSGEVTRIFKKFGYSLFDGDNSFAPVDHATWSTFAIATAASTSHETSMLSLPSVRR
ncbi:MAG TPA: FkbM family methyltransferase [Candidatus Angelobacter sp.]|nr:FkbM family methyltransferase [Candidatus Angelobacter sp.]